MCKPASFIVLKDRVVWSKKTDSHSEIIDEFKLHEGADPLQPNFVRVEITPPDDDMRRPLSEWQYHTDQDRLPKWYAESTAEPRVRAALLEWYAARVIDRDTVCIDAGCWFVVGGTIQSVEGGTIQSVVGGTIQRVECGTIQSVEGGTIQSVEGPANIIVYVAIEIELAAGSQAVVIDRSGSGVKVRIAPK